MVKPEKTVSILIGNSEEILSEIIFELLQETLGDNLSIHVEKEAEKIREISQKNHFDLFVLVLNNIFVRSADNQTFKVDVDRILDIISELKELYNKPVIAMTGWPDDPGFAQTANEAGVDHFFKLPFKLKQFQEAVISSLMNKL